MSTKKSLFLTIISFSMLGCFSTFGMEDTRIFSVRKQIANLTQQIKKNSSSIVDIQKQIDQTQAQNNDKLTQEQELLKQHNRLLDKDLEVARSFFVQAETQRSLEKKLDDDRFFDYHIKTSIKEAHDLYQQIKEDNQEISGQLLDFIPEIEKESDLRIKAVKTEENRKKNNLTKHPVEEKRDQIAQDISQLSENLANLKNYEQDRNNIAHDINIDEFHEQIRTTTQQLENKQQAYDALERSIVVYTPNDKPQYNISTIKKALLCNIGEYKTELESGIKSVELPAVRAKIAKIFNQNHFEYIMRRMAKGESLQIKGTGCLLNSTFLELVNRYASETATRRATDQILPSLKQQAIPLLNCQRDALQANLQILQNTTIDQFQLTSLIEETNELLSVFCIREIADLTDIDTTDSTKRTEFCIENTIDAKEKIAEKALLLEKSIKFDSLVDTVIQYPETTTRLLEIEENKVRAIAVKNNILRSMTMEDKRKIAITHQQDLITSLMNENIEQKIEHKKAIILSLWDQLTYVHNSNFFETIISYIFREKDNRDSWNKLEQFHKETLVEAVHPDKLCNKDFLTIKDFVMTPRANPLNPWLAEGVKIGTQISIDKAITALAYVAPSMFNDMPNLRNINQKIKQTETQLAMGKQQIKDLIQKCERFVN